MPGYKRNRDELEEHKDDLRNFSDQMIEDKRRSTKINIENGIEIYNATHEQFKEIMRQIYELGITKTNLDQHDQKTIDKADLLSRQANPLMVKMNHYDIELKYYTNNYSLLEKEQEIRRSGTKTSFFLQNGYELQFLRDDYVFYNPELYHVYCIKYK
tara:strand:+ start:39 stop:509 length:471 start_codon:yes stop_codon:yes gene_type:complete